MHYLIFGKFHNQSKLLNPNMKAYLIDRNSMINMYAYKYKNHKLKNNDLKNDIFFLEKVKLYRLDNQYEENGDAIMIDPNKDYNYNYYETEIQNKSLSDIFIQLNKTFQDNNIVIHVFSYF